MFRPIKLFIYSLPFLSAVIFSILLHHGFIIKPQQLPPSLLNQAVPDINLPNLLQTGQRVKKTQLLGKTTLVNFFASWSSGSALEHSLLMNLARNQPLLLIGIDSRDDQSDALRLIKRRGNPYQAIAFDPEGQVTEAWKVRGIPETFLIDSKGIVRYIWTGPMDQETWNTQFLPIIKQLRQQQTAFAHP